MANSRDELRYEQLKQTIAAVGLFRRGSVVKRFMPCGKAGCRCKADPPQLHGPYYQWTRKSRGKTVTVRLTREEAALVKAWIANGRQLTKLVSQMEKVALRITDRQLRNLRDS
jgi:hypothetical protein